MTTRKRKSASPPKEDSRTAILDAAEQIFAERGFVGASVRDICARANVNSGLVAYYFKTKDGLFEQVVDRRCDTLLAMFTREMTAVAPLAPGGDSAIRILEAYAGFLLRLTADEEWGPYLRLLAKSAGAYDEAVVGLMLTHFEPMPELVLRLLRDALPDHSMEDIREGLFYLEAALSTIMASGHLLDRRTGQSLDAAHEALARRIARFFSAGL